MDLDHDNDVEDFKSNFENLPLEILLHIITHMDIKDVIRLSMTSTGLKELLTNQIIWKFLFRNNFGPEQLREGFIDFVQNNDDQDDWFNMFRDRYSIEQKWVNEDYFIQFFDYQCTVCQSVDENHAVTGNKAGSDFYLYFLSMK